MKKPTAIPLLLGALAMGALTLIAGAQSIDDADAEALDATEDSTELAIDEETGGESEDPIEDEASGTDPLAELEEPEMDASIDRFDPSEKISEDRSVSFPNDI